MLWICYALFIYFCTLICFLTHNIEESRLLVDPCAVCGRSEEGEREERKGIVHYQIKIKDIHSLNLCYTCPLLITNTQELIWTVWEIYKA